MIQEIINTTPFPQLAVRKKPQKNWGQNILLQVEGNAISCSQKLFNGIKVYPACISQDSSSKVY